MIEIFSQEQKQESISKRLQIFENRKIYYPIMLLTPQNDMFRMYSSGDLACINPLTNYTTIRLSPEKLDFYNLYYPTSGKYFKKSDRVSEFVKACFEDLDYLVGIPYAFKSPIKDFSICEFRLLAETYMQRLAS